MSFQSLGWLAGASVIEAFQAVAAAGLWAASRRRVLPQGFFPSVTVVVPCKDRGADLGANADSLAGQTYAGRWECIFVLSATSDSAFHPLEDAAARAPGGNARLLVTGLTPTHSSAKALNMAFAGSQPDLESEILLFADSDVKVAPDWIQRMVEPLADRTVTVSTAVMLYLPETLTLGSCLRLLWMAAGIPYFEPMRCLCSQSLAIRRADFERLDVAALWRTNLSDDLSLAARLRERGGSMRLVPSATPLSRAPSSLGETVGLFNRWMTLFRRYDLRIWLMGMGQTAFKLAALARSVRHPVCWPLIGLVVGGDIAFLSLVLAALRRSHPQLPLWPAWLAPFLLPLYAVNFAVSAFASEIVWAGYAYRFLENGRYSAREAA